MDALLCLVTERTGGFWSGGASRYGDEPELIMHFNTHHLEAAGMRE
jgi:hypothetical protein